MRRDISSSTRALCARRAHERHIISPEASAQRTAQILFKFHLAYVDGGGGGGLISARVVVTLASRFQRPTNEHNASETHLARSLAKSMPRKFDSGERFASGQWQRPRFCVQQVRSRRAQPIGMQNGGKLRARAPHRLQRASKPLDFVCANRRRLCCSSAPQR